MWRTLIINSAERVTIRDNWVVVQNGVEENRIPVNEIYSIVVDNPTTTFTVKALNTLTANNVQILYCGDKHLPQSITLPLNNHYSPFAVVKRQLEWSQEFCDAIWQKIVLQKILNQAEALHLAGRDTTVINKLKEFANEVELGDTTNREGLSAKMYFRELYGSGFLRMSDDAINYAMNYGYAIMRSSVAKTLCAYGYNPIIGIHHISRYNAFNLADDFMEPFRPLVDLWVDQNLEDLYEELTSDNRRKLVNLLNDVMRFKNKNMKVRNAIDKYICSFTSALLAEDVGLLTVPELSTLTLQDIFEGFDDD